MNTPKQPEDPPKPETPDTSVPDGMADAEPKGYPHSDRQQTETSGE